MNRRGLVAAVAGASEVDRKVVDEVLASLVEVVTDTVAGDDPDRRRPQDPHTPPKAFEDAVLD